MISKSSAGWATTVSSRTAYMYRDDSAPTREAERAAMWNSCVHLTARLGLHEDYGLLNRYSPKGSLLH